MNSVNNGSHLVKLRGLSIRYKILLLLTLIPLITLATYLYVAIYIFENDKIAYVYETSLSTSRMLSGQTTTELNSILKSTKPMMQEFITDRKFGNVTQSILDSEVQLDWIAYYKTDPSTQLLEGFANKLQGLAQKDLAALGSLQDLFKEAQLTGRLVRVPFNDDRVLIVERVASSSTTREGENGYFLMMGKMTELANNYRGSSTEVYLLNSNGTKIFGPDKTSFLDHKKNKIQSFIQDLQKQNNTSGTTEFKMSEQDTFLVSYSKVNFGSLLIISLVNRNEALNAVQTLIRKSIIFFVLVIAAATLISLIASGRLTSALRDLFQATQKVADGKFDIQIVTKSNDEVGRLADSFNIMAQEVSRLILETAEKARMQSELNTARLVQETLFPQTNINLSGFQISGHYEPASECGGDWWHYSLVNNKVFVWIGDATGHGAPAALITSAAKSAATIIERLNVQPAQALELLNRAIYDVSKGRIMMTFFLGCFDLTSHFFTYACASHESPFLIKPNPDGITRGDLLPLNAVNNLRLGQSPDTIYQQAELRLDVGDRILFYTDGLPDIENLEKKSWGERAFLKAIVNSNNTNLTSLEGTVESIVNQFSTFRQNTPLKDDITFFMTEFQKEN